MNLDQFIVVYLNHIGTLAPWIDKAVVFFAEYFPYLVVVGFVVFVAFFFQKENTTPPRSSPLKRGGGRVRLLAEGIGAGIVARAFVEVIRFFFHRPRPFADNPAIISLLNEASYSFPSGHAAFFFALSTIVYIYSKRWGVWFFIASAVIGLARIMAGVHYLTDILGGAVLGIVVGFGVHKLLRRRNTTTPPSAPLLN